MSDVHTLFPAIGNTMSIAVTATASTAVSLVNAYGTVRLVNTGQYPCYVAFSTATTVAATVPTSTPAMTCLPVLAGEDVAFSLPSQQVCVVSAICATAQATTLIVSTGEGV